MNLLNTDPQAEAVYTLQRAAEMLRDARMTVTGATVENVARAVADLRGLTVALQENTLRLTDVAEEAGPPKEYLQ